MAKTKYQIVRVTVTRDYYLPIYDGNKSFDGRTLDAVLQEWFVQYGNQYHATRDGHLISGSQKFLSFTPTETFEMNK